VNYTYSLKEIDFSLDFFRFLQGL